jgi:Tfp pilus assembly protein PilV
MKTNRTKKTARHDKQGERGFSLIETCISMVVMMIAGLACTSLFVFSLQNNVGGGDRALAMAVAQQQMEQLRSVAYEDATLTFDTTTTNTVRNGERGYTVVRTITAETNDDSSSKQLKRITLVVTPTDGAPSWTRSSVTLVSLRSSHASGSYAVQ